MDEEKERAASDKTSREDSTKIGGKTVNKVPQAEDEVNNFNANLITDDTGISDSTEPLAGNKNNIPGITASVNSVNFTGIPSDWWEYSFFAGWKLEGSAKGKPTKRPYDIKTGRPASSTNPKTWTTFERAKAAYLKGGYDGIGIMLSGDDPFVGIDLDNIRDPVTGAIEDWAQVIINQLDSYTEISPSGKGIHIFIRATKPAGTLCRVEVSPGKKLEIYGHARFFTVTGNKLPGPPEWINSRQAGLDEICAQYLSGSMPTISDANLKPSIVDKLVLDPKAHPPVVKFEKICRRRGFIKVWKHERTDFPSLSEYDKSLGWHAHQSGWTFQEYVNLIIPFRHRWRECADDVEKSLNEKYLRSEWAKICQGSNVDASKSLPFKVTGFTQIGTEKARYVITTGEGKNIRVDSTTSLRSPKRMGDLLFEAGYDITRETITAWPDIVAYLHNMVEVKKTATDLELVREWALDLLLIESPSMIDPKAKGSYPNARRLYSNINEAIRDYPSRPAIDLAGRFYFRLTESAILSAVLRFGEDGRSRKLSATLKELDFERRDKVRTIKSGQNRQEATPAQVNVWISPKSFIAPEMVRTYHRQLVEEIEEAAQVEKDRPKMEEDLKKQRAAFDKSLQA